MLQDYFKIFISMCMLFLTCNHAIAASKLPAPLFEQMGEYHHRIDTRSELAQRYFNQGMTLFYGFEFGESIRSMYGATQIDPNCAMCHWGYALSLHYLSNSPKLGTETATALKAIESAAKYVKDQHSIEAELIFALKKLIIQENEIEKNKVKPESGAALYCHGDDEADKKRKKIDGEYLQAMRKIYLHAQNDPDVATLYAISIFKFHDWRFWDTKGQPFPHTHELLGALNGALIQNSHHVGANHYLLHVLESSRHPESAVPQAQRLSYLVPNSEHLVHMPSHIYFRIGEYHDATLANQRAIATYHRFSAAAEAQGFAPSVTYLDFHNHHFLWAAATMEGRKALALSTAATLEKLVPESLIEKESKVQQFLAVPYYGLIRFGEWEQALHMPKPNEVYRFRYGMWHYAQGMAQANLNHLKTAKQHLAELKKISLEKPSELNLKDFGIFQLGMAESVLAAEIAKTEDRIQDQIRILKTAINKQDRYKYIEPPAWYFPVRQFLGAAFISQKRFPEAQTVYEADLKINPHNGWSLFGLHQALQAQSKIRLAKKIETEFDNAWAKSDITLKQSRF